MILKLAALNSDHFVMMNFFILGGPECHPVPDCNHIEPNLFRFLSSNHCSVLENILAPPSVEINFEFVWPGKSNTVLVLRESYFC